MIEKWHQPVCVSLIETPFKRNNNRECLPKNFNNLCGFFLCLPRLNEPNWSGFQEGSPQWSSPISAYASGAASVNGGLIGGSGVSPARVVVIYRDDRGFGFVVAGDNPVFVQTVREGKFPDASSSPLLKKDASRSGSLAIRDAFLPRELFFCPLQPGCKMIYLCLGPFPRSIFSQFFAMVLHSENRLFIYLFFSLRYF